MEIEEKENDAAVTRRSFISILASAWTLFCITSAGSLAATLRFFFPNVLFEPPETFAAGLPGEYPLGEVNGRWKKKYNVWLVHTDEGLYALSSVCTHLGCSVNWLEEEGKFKCPCHGSGYYKDGVNFEGPAPRPLERFRIVMGDDGRIIVDKSKKFLMEKGGWSSPESILRV